MNSNNSIKKNMVMSIILTSSNFVFPLITYAYVARILSADGTGKIFFVQSVLAYFAYIATLGIPNYGVRESAKCREDKEQLSKLVHELLIINLIATLIAYITLIIAVLSINKFQIYMPLFAVMSWTIILQTLGIEWLYKGLEKYTYITIRSIVFKIISVVLVFMLVKSPDDLIVYGALTIFATSASNVLNFINARKYIYIKRYKHYELRKHMKPIMVFFMSTLIITLYGHFDTLMLGFLIDDTEVGLYNAGLKFKTAALSISTALTTVLIPRMSIYASSGSTTHFLDLFRKSFRLTCVVMIPLTFYTIINANDLVLLLCGSDFISAVPATVILMICIIPLSMANLFGNQVLIPLGQEKLYSQTVFIGMWINLIANFLLIPKFGASGAALATLGTEIFNAIWMARYSRNMVNGLFSGLKVGTYLFSVAIASVVCIALNYFISDLTIILRIIVSGSAFSITYCTILLLRKEPIILIGINVLKNFLKR